MTSAMVRTTAPLPEYIPVPVDNGTKMDSDMPECSTGNSPGSKAKKQKKGKERRSDGGYSPKSRKLPLPSANKPPPNPENRLPPWVRPDSNYPVDIIGLNAEIEDFYNYMKPTDIEHKVRCIVFKRVQQVIQYHWPGAIVDWFGSTATGLCLPTSDIDVVVIGKWDQLPLRTLEQVFRETPFIESDSIRVIDKASVPIVKIVDIETKVRLDVSFNVTNGVQSAGLIKKYMEEFPPLPKLAFVLKQFLFQRDLNEVFTGGLSSYCLTLMIISFLQLHSSRNTRRENQNLAVLLVEFFELYGRHFNYLDIGISVRDGGRYVPKDRLFPQEAAMSDGYRAPLLCLEDPLRSTNDIGRSSYAISKVKEAFQSAYVTLSKAVLKPKNFAKFGLKGKGTLLQLIITVPEKTVEYRQWLENKFANTDFINSFYMHVPAQQSVIIPSHPPPTDTVLNAWVPNGNPAMQQLPMQVSPVQLSIAPDVTSAPPPPMSVTVNNVQLQIRPTSQLPAAPPPVPVPAQAPAHVPLATVNNEQILPSD